MTEPLTPESTHRIVMPVPTAMPFGSEVLPEHTQEVWDVFVKPYQQDPQSVEMRMLMAILRAFNQGVVTDD